VISIGFVRVICLIVFLYLHNTVVPLHLWEMHSKTPYITWYVCVIRKYSIVHLINYTQTLPTLNKEIIQCTVHCIVHLRCTVHCTVHLLCTVHCIVHLQCTVHLQCAFSLCLSLSLSPSLSVSLSVCLSLSLSLSLLYVWSKGFWLLAWVLGQTISPVLGAFGLLDFSVLWPVLAWHPFSKLKNSVFFIIFQFLFQAPVNHR
jgi:hypothetical protein